MKTYEDAFDEFNMNFKEDFYYEWKSLSDKKYLKEFYYWCSMYDDTKHLRPTKERKV
jgi:hypothetical protein